MVLQMNKRIVYYITVNIAVCGFVILNIKIVLIAMYLLLSNTL